MTRTSRLVWLWLIWLLVLWTYQAAVVARYQLQRPDHVLGWTAGIDSVDRPYLTDPFLNTQVGWDSEFYLSIALQGYDDPKVRTAPPLPEAKPPFDKLSINYAFFPVYPLLIRALAMPLSFLAAIGISPVGIATLAGVIISALGTLAGLLALADLTQSGQASGQDPSQAKGRANLRAATYLLIFPSSFFLAQVYTEGLFVGLSFGCLALLERQRWGGATGLATIAVLTRAVGVLLVVPLGGAWVKRLWQEGFTLRAVGQGLLLGIPILVHLTWRASFWGEAFGIVQRQFFGCQLLNFQKALPLWGQGLLALLGDNSAATVHYAIELAAVVLGFTACLLTLKRYPAISIYGLAIMLTSTTCGTAWSISRYLLTVPSVFLVLNQLGRSELFDRLWSMISLLLLALLTTLFCFDFWAG
jgi:hypothetical protein